MRGTIRAPSGCPRSTDPLSPSCRVVLSKNPRWHTTPTIQQLAVEPAVLGTVTADDLPEAARMIHLLGVGQLVDHEITHHLRALEHQAAIETDRATRRATAPAT